MRHIKCFDTARFCGLRRAIKGAYQASIPPIKGAAIPRFLCNVVGGGIAKLLVATRNTMAPWRQSPDLEHKNEET